MAAELAPSEDPQRRFSELAHMGQAVLQMTRDATTALRRMDVSLATRVWRDDAAVDREYEGLMRQLATHMMEDPDSIPRALNVMWATRSLERIGDRARNICEYVVYLVEGVDVRHTNLATRDGSSEE
jgi:phosphate transport system protein